MEDLYIEVFGKDSLYYGLFEDQADRRVKTHHGLAAWWWLRSGGGGYDANTVGASGISNYYHVDNSGGVAVGFCL